MGIFDFTYADNGENTRGRNGYLYMTDNFCERTGLKSPLRISGMDSYGMMDILLPQHKNILEIDIYAIYAAMLYLNNLCPDTTKHDIFLFLELLTYYRKHKEFSSKEDYDAFEDAMDNIRCIGIDYFFDHQHKILPPQDYVVKALGNQRSKHISQIDTEFTGEIPLVITRKRLPAALLNEPFHKTIRNWGFVSSSDPLQGCGITRNHFMPWSSSIV